MLMDQKAKRAPLRAISARSLVQAGVEVPSSQSCHIDSTSYRRGLWRGLSTATARKLEQTAAEPRNRDVAKTRADLAEAGHAARAGVARGHPMVLIHADGIEWRGQRYRSLSLVARKITGARWSGPRFFGLRQRPLESASTARPGHGQG